MGKAENLALVAAGLAGAFALLSRRTLAADGPLDIETMRTLALGAPFDNPDMIVRIAWIESNFNPSAVRYEPHIQDASAGLMQTLLSTARWLASDMGYRRFGVPELDDLFRAQTSVFFGGAYLNYLSRYRGQARSEEWVVRSYNGGPGHSQGATDAYWRKYLASKERWG